MSIDAELIAAVRKGERITTAQCEFVLHDAEIVVPGHGYDHKYRVIACDYSSDRDAVECRVCGHQTTVACNFDEEYS